MDYRYLGRSALKVSPLCLGAMMFGGETDEASSKRIIDKAFDQGVNFIDTADVYHAGRSEEIVGRAIAERRDNWVVATKFGYPTAQGPNEQGQSRKWIIQSVEVSLKRLGTDYIDILYFHRALADAPLEEGVRAIGDLIRQGKIRYFGVSNFRGWRIAEIARLADQLGIDRPVASEPLYNIVDRTAEVEQLPAAEHYGLGVVPYSPLARGVLSGKYAVDATPPADSRAGRGDKRIQQTEWRPESLRIAQTIAEHAAQRGTTSIAFALAWVLKNRLVSSTIAGPRTEAQWDSYVDALTLQLGPEDEKLVDSLVAPGHASTPGYTDPGYPVEGRRIAGSTQVSR
ncbi:1-deoxyxylulose-5-phosphate synthase YajO [Paraburkholderia domus]|jgi:Predicted oxidoreductases (related to aryl-alcohol dehydrogenases)|uniref:1-deoxyxylulose-5-phosphate synthase YajO n=1 Tax=Paraburkholderia domus TaxID=2793075 RepID=A0A9N8N2W7_9BURK|nr:aldo/keto reductase [Paraburkholderia domus]MBK5050185.1 aldo/keto reductase [Burkholderia sp. R-70006]MBK5062528.1 aldo/keto reductase [Burkholderia sp. R-70199]MBK5088684.1 aldo/keto reductase [Burkholderia sp. R-69927]MBK5168222.1 aldo/keto reductase [Burkholderia sp. R-70211]MCI0144825.1 aldo/keto reductase [Paraburkholderia sediminicola]